MSKLLSKVLARYGAKTQVPFRVTFADGTTYRNRDETPVLGLTFKTAVAQRRVIAFGHIGLLEAYFDGDLEVEGELRQAFRFGFESRINRKPPLLVRRRNRRHEQRYSNRSLAQAKVNARFHYGLPQAFHARWLDDPLMMYTCAYWKEGTRDLEEAQRNKVDHVCRKIRLSEGETFVDIGCGFGGFLFHALERYGALGTGVNTTTEQVQWLREEVQRRGLADKIQVREADFREVHAQFDKVVSVGVLEHAGRDQQPEVIKAHADFLKPGGLGMLHFIGHVGERPTELFIRDHVFPGGWIPSLSTTLAEMEKNGLEILEVENLRRHYALTLDAWAERFDAQWEAIHAMDPKRFDERFRRIWRTYLLACAEMFRAATGETHLFQITFSKGNVTPETYPMSRGFLYQT